MSSSRTRRFYLSLSFYQPLSVNPSDLNAHSFFSFPRRSRLPPTDKLQTLQTELSHLRLTSKHLETSNASLETRLIELTDQLEMVTLDKEFAEEKGENLESELEGEREKCLELEVEVEVLRGENG